jgi:undecaprenyl-diphosphatase
MGWLEALVLGVVQGLTEFLPISSSAHQSIVGQFFGGEDVGSAFTAITQLGTEAAVVIYFRRDIWLIIRSWVGSLTGKVPRDNPEARMGWLVIIGSVPIVVLGLLFQDSIDTVFRNLWVPWRCWPASAWSSASRTGWPVTSAAGVAHLAARGAVRAGPVARADPRRLPVGATIAAGLAMGYQRVAAAKYAFCWPSRPWSDPGFFKLADITNDPVEPAWGQIALATVVSFVIGYAVIAWLLRYISTHDFLPFVVYRIALAAVVAVLLLTGFLEPLPAAVPEP